MVTNSPVIIDELFGELIPSKEGENWVVVYTKPKREKKLAKYATENNISYYLPLIESERVYKDRKVIFTKPLFSGYIFFKCSIKEKQTLIISGHIVTFIKVQNEFELLEELEQIYLSKNRGGEFVQGEYFEKGTKVMIIAGPFEGLTGVIKDQNNVTEVMMQVKMLHQAIAISVKSNQIKVIN